MLEPHERQAQRNHQQTLEELADRGGLDPSEMMRVLEDRKWDHNFDAKKDLESLIAAVKAFESGILSPVAGGEGVGE